MCIKQILSFKNRAETIQNLVSSLLDEVIVRSTELSSMQQRAAAASLISPADVDTIFAGTAAIPEIGQMSFL